jgi:hypothetical protein
MRYKRDVMEELKRALIGGPVTAAMVRNHFEPLFVRWVYTAAAQGSLKGLLPTESLVIQSDVAYFCLKHKVTIPTLRPIRMPRMEDVGLMQIGEKKLTERMVLQQCSIVQWHNLQRLYGGEAEEMLPWCNAIIQVYTELGGINNNASMPPNFIKAFPGATEMFGSPLNTSVDYCSPFAWEHIFSRGSQHMGSFFALDGLDKSRIYLANPPYCETLMGMMIEHLIKLLDVYEDATVIVIMPNWDKFRAMDVLENSRHVTAIGKTDKYKHLFYDFFKDRYLPLSSVHLLLLGEGSRRYTVERILGMWLDALPRRKK